MKKKSAVSAAAEAATGAATPPVEPTNGQPPVETAGDVTSDAAAEKAAAETAAGAQELSELEQLRKQLTAETNRANAAEQYLTQIQEADAQILALERIAQKRQAELEESDKTRKELKKAFDATIAELRSKLQDRASGQLNLFAPKAPPQAKGKSKAKAEADVSPEAATVSPATKDEAAAAGEEISGATPAAPAKTEPTDWWLKASLGSVSVAGEKPGEMQSLPPSMVKLLAKNGIATVQAAIDFVESGSKLDGFGPTGRRKAKELLDKWVQESSGTKPGPTVSEEGGAATDRVCGYCAKRWPLPSAVVKCPECGQDDLIYEVGCFGEPNCDADGDYVTGLEQMEFTVPAVKGMPGLESYQFRLVLAATSTGHFIPGYEIGYQDSVGESKYPNVKDVCLERTAALEQGAYLLRTAAFTMLASKPAQEAWDKAAEAKIGVKPVQRVGNAQAAA